MKQLINAAVIIALSRGCREKNLSRHTTFFIYIYIYIYIERERERVSSEKGDPYVRVRGSIMNHWIKINGSDLNQTQ